jgi:hypothetical protein
MLPIDHADEAVLDGDVNASPRGGDHARGGDLGDKLILGDVEVADQAGRNGTAAGLDPTRPVDQRHLVTGTREVFGSCSTGGSTPYNNNIVKHGHSPGTAAPWGARVGLRSMMRTAM